MTVAENFIEWEKTVSQDIQFIARFLSEKLSDEPEALISDLQHAEAWNARAGFMLAEANSWLDKACFALKPEKASGGAFDRQIELDSLTAPFRVTRDKLEALNSALKQRLILGESLLGYFRQFVERKTLNEKQSLRQIMGARGQQ